MRSFSYAEGSGGILSVREGGARPQSKSTGRDIDVINDWGGGGFINTSQVYSAVGVTDVEVILGEGAMSGWGCTSSYK